jgi:hypothetical protein
MSAMSPDDDLVTKAGPLVEKARQRQAKAVCRTGRQEPMRRRHMQPVRISREMPDRGGSRRSRTRINRSRGDMQIGLKLVRKSCTADLKEVGRIGAPPSAGDSRTIGGEI